MYQDENLADELKLRDNSPYHAGLTGVAHKNNRDVCWVCFEPIGSRFVDIPMKASWIRICQKLECEKQALKEPMGDVGTSSQIRTQVMADLKPNENVLKNAARSLPDFARRKR